MVKLADVKASNTALISSTSQPIVGIFVGATSGIGSYTVHALASAHGKTGPGLRAYIIGRRAQAAESLIAKCKVVCPSGQFVFVRTEDISLLKNVKIACDDVTRQEEASSAAEGRKAKVDILVMSQGQIQWDGRKVTSEGLDMSMSLLYYSRIRFTTLLAPLLTSSSLLKGASVVSVYAAGAEATFFRDDLSLSQPGHYTFANCRSHSVHMKTCAFEHIAAEHRQDSNQGGGISLVHVFPSIVLTEGFDNPTNPMWFKILRTLLGPLLKLYAVAGEESGERMLGFAGGRWPARGVGQEGEVAIGTDGVKGSGAYAVKYDGERIESKAWKGVDKEKLKEEVWTHTMAVFETIDKGGKFEG